MRESNHIQKVLVVDDDEGVRELLHLTLASLGFEVFDAGDAEKGLEIFESEFPDLVITDFSMGVIDGGEFARMLKSIDPLTPIMLITGYLVGSELELICADSILTKPFRREALANQLQSLGLEINVVAA